MNLKIAYHVYVEEDYTVFKKLDNNRIVTDMRVKRLLKSFGEGIIRNPIIVNSKFEIIDGQGRYEARKAMGLPIEYIIDNDATIKDCQRMNMYNSNWTSMDFCVSYAMDGNENYINLYECYKQTELPLNKIIRYANRCAKRKGGDLSNRIQDGSVVFTKDDIDKVIFTKMMIDEVRNALLIDGRLTDTFGTALAIIRDFPGYNHKRLIENCKKCRTSFTQMSKLEDMLKEFSRVYNYRTATKNKLFFEDYMRNRGANVRSYDGMSDNFMKDIRKDISTLQKGEEDE